MPGDTRPPLNEKVQAGWYPDPLGLPQLRWWDNHAWTEHVSDSMRQPRVMAQSTPPVYADPPRIVEHAPVSSAVADPRTSELATVASAELPVGAAPPEIDATPPSIPSLPSASPAPQETPHTAAAPDTAAAPLTPESFPSSAPEIGWAGAALTLHSVLAARSPMLLELEIVGHPRIRIDTRYGAFAWDLPLTSFPDAPMAVRVGVELVPITAPPVFLLPGQSLDELLWRIGLIAFPTRSAPWLEPGARHRLTRWPNLSTLQPSMEQMRQTAMLANQAFTVEQLAHATGVSIENTRTLVNAVSLIGSLETLAPELAPVQASHQPPPRIDRERGLFRRLRDTLGL